MAFHSYNKDGRFTEVYLQKEAFLAGVNNLLTILDGEKVSGKEKDRIDKQVDNFVKHCNEDPKSTIIGSSVSTKPDGFEITFGHFVLKDKSHTKEWYAEKYGDMPEGIPEGVGEFWTLTH